VVGCAAEAEATCEEHDCAVTQFWPSYASCPFGSFVGAFGVDTGDWVVVVFFCLILKRV
jgi:hypothetical protein